MDGEAKRIIPNTWYHNPSYLTSS